MTFFVKMKVVVGLLVVPTSTLSPMRSTNFDDYLNSAKSYPPWVVVFNDGGHMRSVNTGIPIRTQARSVSFALDILFFSVLASFFLDKIRIFQLGDTFFLLGGFLQVLSKPV